MAINNIPRNFQYWANISATPNDFNLDAGAYALTLHATTWGTAALQKLLPDGATYVTVLPFTADGTQQVQCAAGQYRMTLTGVVGLVGEIAKIASGSG